MAKGGRNVWEQIHIFFDIASAVGAGAFFVIGLLIKLQIAGMRNSLEKSIAELKEDFLVHGGKCDAERAELFRQAYHATSRDSR